MPIRKLEISDIVDAVERPYRLKGASFLFAQASWLNLLRNSLIAAGALAGGFLQYRKFAMPLVMSGVGLFLLQSAPGLRGLFAGPLAKRLSALRKHHNRSALDNLDAALAALATIGAMKARARGVIAAAKPNLVQYALERFLFFWPLLVLAALILDWPVQLTPIDTEIAVGALAGLIIFGALFYLGLIYQHPAPPTQEARVLAISAHWAQHLRQAVYFTTAAALWYAIAKTLPSVADENLRHTLAVAFIIPTFATSVIASGRKDVPVYAARDALRFDQRPPFLFLRSFKDEFVATPSATLQSASGGRMMNLAIEMIVKDALHGMGPFIAIADPGRGVDLRTIMIGAMRERLRDEDWQETAAGWIRDAAAVIMIPGPSEGTQWELSQIVRQGKLQRLILLFPQIINADDLAAAKYWRHTLYPLAGSTADSSVGSIDTAGLRALTFQAAGVTAIYCRATTDTAFELALLMALASTQ